jgi:putative tricarboxylic transport membrane protein
MNKTPLVEGLVFVAVGVIALIEGLRIAGEVNPTAVIDLLGPADYIIFASIGLIVTGLLYIVTNYRKIVGGVKLGAEPKEEKQVWMSKIVFLMVLVFGAYIYLIHILGYLLSTFIFLFLEFRLAGVKSWFVSGVVSAPMAAALYFLFLKFAGMVFPRGLLGF